MTINSLIAYAYTNKLDFDKDIAILSESIVDNGETALVEDYPSFAISHEDKHLVILPKRIASDKDYRKELKHRKIDTVEIEEIHSNVNVDLKLKEVDKEGVCEILENELNFKDFAEISLLNGKILIQVSEKAKTDSIVQRFYGYTILFDKMNAIWFKKNKDLEYHWEYGRKVLNK